LARSTGPSDASLEALALHQAGRADAAFKRYRATLAENPDDFHAHLWLGVLFQQGGRSEQAKEHLERAAALRPEVPDAWVNLGVVRQALGRADTAEAAFRRALELEPDGIAAWLGLGKVLQETGRDSEAEQAYRQAERIDPTDPRPAFNRATLLAGAGRARTALDACRQALDRDPTLAPAHGLAADCLINLGRYRDARDHALAGLERAPDHPELLYTLGFAEGELGRLPAARDAFDAALEAEPRHAGALAAALFTRRQLCDWRMVERLRARSHDALRRGLPGLTPFSFLAETDDRALQRDCARLWARQWPARAEAPRRTLPARDDGRITLAYLSADFYNHPTAHLAAGLFETHDRSRFRVLAYSNSRDEDSPVRRRLEAAFDRFTDLRDHSPRAAAERMRADGVDILVDLKGHTLEAATGILAWRPAPIQVQYLGYPGTLGAPWIDYLVGDPVVTPEAHQGDYDEALVRLPHSYQVNDDRRPRPPAQGRRGDLGLPEDGVVFCCFNNAWKLNRDVLDAWLKVLAAVPGSVLWLLGRQSAPETAANLRAETARGGVDPARLVFSKSRPLEAYLALYHHADLFLDTWPYNAHTTASDALWMGCPVITRRGESFPSRVGASLLHASGLPELVCDSVHDYVSRATALGRDPSALGELRRRLDTGRTTNPLFDTVRFTGHIEQAYEEMIRRHDAGAPGPFTIGDDGNATPGARRS